MSDIIHTVGDTGTQFISTIYDEAGAIVDISGATTLQMRFFKPDATLVTKTAVFVTDGTDGQLKYTSVTDDIDVAGDWTREAYVVLPAGEWTTTVVGFHVKPTLGAPYYFTDLTRLESINLMMAAAGEPPVDTYLGSLEADVVLAMRILDDANRRVQSKGWSFNQDLDVTLIPDEITSEIVLDPDVVFVEPVFRGDEFTIRAGKLYDRYENRFTFNEQPRMNVVYRLAMGDLPTHARVYITAMASRMFTERLEGGANPVLRDEEQMARVDFMSVEARADDVSLGRYSPASIVMNRRTPARWRHRG